MHSKNQEQPSAYRQEVLKMRERKQEKHDKSHVRHPVRSFKRGYGKIDSKRKFYWEQGQQLGQARLNHQVVPKAYTQRDVKKYIKTNMSAKARIFLVVIVALIFIIMMYGILH